jgi:SAM-dependent methyltransferase
MAASAARSPPAIDQRMHRLVTCVSVALSTVATLCLVHLLRHASASCFPALTLSLAPFPRTSCDAASRRVLPPDRRLAKLRYTQSWTRCTVALSKSALPPLRGLGLLGAHSRVLCLAAGAGHAVDAFLSAGVREVTGIDLFDFPPLVHRGDPHHLPYSDGAFDLVFSGDPRAISGALFPTRLVAEAERAVRRGGGIVVAVGQEIETAAMAGLFRRSRLVDVKDVTLDGSQVRMLIFHSNGTTSNLH